MKAKKGYIVVQVVGTEEEENGGGCKRRFEVPISHLYHPLFIELLDRAYEAFGYHANGPLRLPCSVDDFLQIRWQIERESSYYHQHHHHYDHHHHHHHHQHHQHGHYRPLTLHFRSC